MNDQQLEKKVGRDIGKVKKDLGTLVGDIAARINRVDDNVSQATVSAKNGVTTWTKDSTSQVSEAYDKAAGDVKESVDDAASTVKKDVGHGLSQYNTKAQQVADKIPGDFGKKAAQNPWVMGSIALGVGFMLGSILFAPTRKHSG